MKNFFNLNTKQSVILFIEKDEIIYSYKNTSEHFLIESSIENTIKKINNQYKLKNTNIIVILDNSFINILTIELLNVEHENMKNAIYWTLEENYGIEPEKNVFDITYIKNNNSHGFLHYTGNTLIQDIINSLNNIEANILNITTKTEYYIDSYFKNAQEGTYLLDYVNDYLYFYLISEKSILNFRSLKLNSPNIDYLETEEFTSQLLSFIQDSLSYVKRYFSNIEIKKLTPTYNFLPTFCKEMIEDQFSLTTESLFSSNKNLPYIEDIKNPQINLVIEGLIEPNIPYSFKQYKKFIKTIILLNIIFIPIFVLTKQNYQKKIELINIEISELQKTNAALAQKSNIVIDDKDLKELDNINKILTFKKSQLLDSENNTSLLQRLEKSMPLNIWLDELEYKNNYLYLKGKSTNINDIHSFIEKLRQEKLLITNLQNLQISNEKDNDGLYSFVINK